ncbi:MAG: hypothetical protein NC253_01505 [Ruminococcus sp.]|nr:hypothetical protein [Ruminococcus sp.]MCM1381159.1 hypothetical protein [Muribaculaceae bacterium]MCM1479650.1 hypothetical protein [Muribaculaceae bacterium]
MVNIKSKVLAVADKVTNSKVYKGLEKAAVLGSTALMTAGATVIGSSAAEVDNTVQNALSVTVSSAEVLNNAQPFITPAITLLCIVGGMKLGMRFLRSAMH